jgi:phosphoglycerate kinase
LPSDVVVAGQLKEGVSCRTTNVRGVGKEEMILDVGRETIEAFEKRLHNTRTLVWNGPLGAFETSPFDKGTNDAARLVAERTRAGNLLSVAGGGDTVSALNRAGVADDFSYVSTAGGAFLEWLEGQELPAVAALVARGAGR